ncbi:MAG: hypothetical protein IH851_02990 [Armatimonadetes bacterium]|nr:hypothetical protein [Armatimonadota bacterium]
MSTILTVGIVLAGIWLTHILQGKRSQANERRRLKVEAFRQIADSIVATQDATAALSGTCSSFYSFALDAFIVGADQLPPETLTESQKRRIKAFADYMSSFRALSAALLSWAYLGAQLKRDSKKVREMFESFRSNAMEANTLLAGLSLHAVAADKEELAKYNVREEGNPLNTIMKASYELPSILAAQEIALDDLLERAQQTLLAEVQ